MGFSYNVTFECHEYLLCFLLILVSDPSTGKLGVRHRFSLFTSVENQKLIKNLKTKEGNQESLKNSTSGYWFLTGC